MQHVYSLSVYPSLCSHLRTKDSQLTSAREELMDLRFDVELRAASLCRSQATLATEQLNCKWQPLPCTTYVLTYVYHYLFDFVCLFYIAIFILNHF